MIGIDTNVLIGYTMQDDAKQSPQATRLLQSLGRDEPGFVPLVAVVELVFVLSSSYGLNRDQIAEALDLLMRRKELVADRADLVLQAQRRFAKGGADFVDCLIERTAHAQGCQATMTFDAGAAKAADMTLATCPRDANCDGALMLQTNFGSASGTNAIRPCSASMCGRAMDLLDATRCCWWVGVP